MRQAGTSPGVAEIGALAVSGPTTMLVAGSILTLGRSAIGPAPSSDARLFVYPTTFHPDTPNPVKATVFSLGSGEERGGLDLHLLAVPTRRVSGVVVSPDRQSGGIPIRIVPEDADDSPIDQEVASTVTSKDGTFSFPAVPIGNYLIRALSGVALTGGVLGTTVIQTAAGVTISSPDTPPLRFLPTSTLFDTRWASLPLAVGRDDVSGGQRQAAVRGCRSRDAWSSGCRPKASRPAARPDSGERLPASPTSRIRGGARAARLLGPVRHLWPAGRAVLLRFGVPPASGR